jgi:hypothetical protein
VGPGAASFSLSLSGARLRNEHVEECPDIGPACDSTEITPYRHDLRVGTGDLTLAGQIGLVQGLAAEFVVPLRLNRERITFRRMDGTPFTPVPPDYHHADRTLAGLGDPWLVAHYGGSRGVWSFGARLGGSVPLGRTEENPFALGEQGLPHEHVQFGAGTVQPIAGLGAARDFGKFALSAHGLARLGIWTNRHGYRPGDQVLASLAGTGGLGLTGWRFQAGPTIYHESAETWDGGVQEEGNLGRTDAFAEASAARSLSGGWGVNAELRVPLWTKARGAQLDVPVSLRLGISRMFGMMAP